MLGDYATEESVASLKKQLGLDRPVYEQYAGFVARALTGDLGNSVVTGQPAFGEVLSSLPWSAALAPCSPIEADLMRTLEHPSAAHLLGTDQYGRDVLSRLIWGARISINVALSVVVLSLTFGSILGAVAGYSGGWLAGRRKALVHAVDCVSFTLHAGETLGLVGETGSGKSTLGRLVLRLVEPTAGRIWLDGEDLTGLSNRQMRRRRREVQMVFQDPYGSLDPRMKVGALVAEPMVVHGTWRGDGRDRVLEVIHKVGLQEDHLDRYPHEFSGGQRQRIGIARAMALKPRVLVLDEPVSALDVSIQAQIINLLRDLQQESGMGFLFIAHDLAVVRHVSDRVAVMYLGRIVEIGPRDAIYRAPAHPYTLSLLSAVPVPEASRARARNRVVLHGEIGSATRLPGGCRFHPRCYLARIKAGEEGVETVEREGERLPAVCVHRDPDPVELSPGHEAACHFPERAGRRSEVALRAMDFASGDPAPARALG